MPLLVDFCTHEAAKHAVMNWHYSQTMPVGKLVKCGVWENTQFIGAVVFGRGASPNYGKAYSLPPTGVCELVRVALASHQVPVTQIVSQSLSLLHKTNPGLRLVVSFADSGQGHLGTIYQAGNWVYLGTTSDKYEYRYNGKWTHDRLINQSRHLVATLPRRAASTKFRYAFPLDKKMRRQLEPLALPYPTKTDLAVQVSEAKHQPSGLEGRVQSLGTAPIVD